MMITQQVGTKGIDEPAGDKPAADLQGAKAQ